jgi:hypothetical protein
MFNANKVTEIIATKFLKVTTTSSGGLEVAIDNDHLKQVSDTEKVKLMLEAQKKLVAAGITSAADGLRLGRPPSREDRVAAERAGIKPVWRSWIHLSLKAPEASTSPSVEAIANATRLAQMESLMAMLDAGAPPEVIAKVRASMKVQPAPAEAEAEAEVVVDADAEAPI